MSIVTNTQLRKINWAKDYLWEIQFPEAPDKFSDWFPAETVSHNLWSSEARTIASLYSIPGLSSPFSTTVTFLDSIDLELENWIKSIVNDIMLPSGTKGRAYLEDIVTPLVIRRLNNKMEPIDISGRWVFPTGSFNFEGSNQSQSSASSVEFISVGNYKV